MQLILQMKEINQELAKFWHSKEFLLIVFILLLASIITLVIGWANDELRLILPTWFKWSYAAVIMILISVIFNFGKENNKLLSQYEDLKTEFYYSIKKTVTVTPKDIVNSIPIPSSFCPHVELKEDESCTYLEFITDKEITQVFIALKSDIYMNVKENVSITYLDLSKEERAMINQMFDIKNVQINQHHKIKENNWSLGISVDK